MARASRSGTHGLYRDADSRWRIDLRWDDPQTGEPRRFREKLPVRTSAEAAKRRAGAILNGALDGSFDPDAVAPAPPEAIGVTLDRYLAACETRGLRSIASRRTHVKALVAFFDRPLASIATSDVEALQARLLATGRSRSTANRHVTTLKHAASWAARDGVIDRAASSAIRDVRLLGEPEGRVRYLSPSEERDVNAKLAGWLRPIALACKYTGARIGEITSLRWRDVDRSAEIVRFTRTKTDTTREVPIVPALGEILDLAAAGEPSATDAAIALVALLERHGSRSGAARSLGVTETAIRKWQTSGVPRERRTGLAGGATRPPDLEGYVFPIPRRQGRPGAVRTEAARRRDVASRAWSAFAAGAGLRDLHAHDLRHHAATMIRRAGGGLDTVAKLLGHTNIRTSARYAHVHVEDTRAFLTAASFAQPLPNTPKATTTKPRKNKAPNAHA